MSSGFSELKKWMVWHKGREAYPRDPSEWRLDDFNRLIKFSEYGNRESPYGWEIDHKFPASLGGLDDLDNCRPLSCYHNARLGGLLSSLLKSM